MFKKIFLALTALPRIFNARVRFPSHKPCIGLAVSDDWPDRFEFRRLPYDLALARAGASVVTFRPQNFPELDKMLDSINGLVLAGGEVGLDDVADEIATAFGWCFCCRDRHALSRLRPPRAARLVPNPGRNAKPKAVPVRSWIWRCGPDP